MVHGTEEPMIMQEHCWRWTIFGLGCCHVLWQNWNRCVSKSRSGTSFFTFTIFNRECRYKSEAWHVLGYIPDLEMRSSSYKAKPCLGAKGKGRPCRNYHMLKKDFEVLHWQSRKRWTHLCLDQNWRESIICLSFFICIYDWWFIKPG